MFGDGLLDVVAEVMQQMPPVRDLGYAGQGTVGAFGVAAAAVSADHLHARVGAQPAGEGFRVAIGQHVDRLVVAMSSRIVA